MQWYCVVHVTMKLHLAARSLANVHKVYPNYILDLGVEVMCSSCDSGTPNIPL